MRFLEGVLAHRASSETPLAQVLAADGRVARSHSYREMLGAAGALVTQLADQPPSARIGLLVSNSPEWLVADLAVLTAGLVEIPVPLAFSAEQAASLLGEAAVCLVDEPGAARLQEWGAERVLTPRCRIQQVKLGALAPQAEACPPPPPPAADGICKIVHTSGTTSAPKGVLIRREGLDQLIASLDRHVDNAVFARYLSLVPLSLLIEQVVGAYMVMNAGGTVVFLPPSEPLLGTVGASAYRLLRSLLAARPTSMVVPPVMVEAIASVAEQHCVAPCRQLFGRDEPPFLACGGAPVAPEVLARLDAVGIPVYEGYGLSENGSVVAWNTPAHRRLGTVGRPLDHVQVRVASDGELLIRSTSLFAGYTRADPSSCVTDADGWLHTGDLAAVDDDGYLKILGRKKNMIITSSGRNVAPEWVETQYTTLDAVEAAVIFGDGQEALTGLFVIADGGDLLGAAAEIRALGRSRLSDVERVQRFGLISSHDDMRARDFTVTGRPMRKRIYDCLAASLGETITLERRKDPEMMTVAPYGEGTGLLVQAQRPGTLTTLSKQALLELLRDAGFLLLRGFEPSIEDFTHLVEQVSTRVTLDPAREFRGKVAQKVDAGLDEIGLHCENGNTPFLPHLAWFFCERPASRGSQTTVCDGYRVWESLSPAARDAFGARDIVYTRTVEATKWKTFVHHAIAGSKPLAEIALSDLEALLTTVDGATVASLPDGSIVYAFRTRAAHPTLFDDRIAFANSILGPSFNYERPRITFGAGGEELNGQLLEEVSRVTTRLTEDLNWVAGDVAVIDNTRVMHGRRAILDPDRTIYNALSYIDHRAA